LTSRASDIPEQVGFALIRRPIIQAKAVAMATRTVCLDVIRNDAEQTCLRHPYMSECQQGGFQPP
jgi:hypothetical protein